MSFPKPPEIKEVIIGDDFHDLFHSIWRCHGYPGGRRQHFQHLWDYKWDVRSKVKRMTHCTFGRHKPMPWFRGDGIPRSEGGKLVYAGHQCVWCRKTMTPASPEE